MLIVETLFQRWYAWAFLGLFFWAASAERGAKRAVRFWLTAAVIEFTFEVTSTRVGFPFGRYSYNPGAIGDELTLAGVPIFVPLTFAVVVWAGRSLAQVGLKAHRPEQLILAGALFAALIDLIIDPMTLRGRMWFLGPLYAFESLGGWFNVPWTNFAGWVLTAGLVLWVDELFEHGRARTVEPVRGPTLAVVIVAFFVVLAVVTTQWAIVGGQLAVAALLYVLTAAHIREAIGRPGRGARGG